MAQPRKKLVFYVDTDCFFSHDNVCSYYSEKRIQKLVGKDSKRIWGHSSCPIVYVKKGRRFTAFCPTQSGALGEQLPSMTGPKTSALRVDLKPRRNETWNVIVERAARTACEARI